MSKYLIMGAGGFVASYLIPLLLENNEEVYGMVRWNEDLSRMEKYKDKIEIIYADQLDLSSLIRGIMKCKPDVISFLSAQSWVSYSFDVPINTIETNGIGCVNLFEAIRIIRDYIDKNYNPLVHICSSSEVYGKVDKNKLPITEEHPMNPGNQYGVGKVLADQTAQFYAKYYGFRVLITRMFTHTGIGRTMMSAENYYAREVALIETGKKEPHIEIGDKKAMQSLRTWADVRDAVKNYYTLFKNGMTGIYNISGETTKTIQEVLDYLISISELKNISNLTMSINPKFIRKINVDKQIVDISKYKNENEWSNEIRFEELMQSLLDSWRQKCQ